jgi:hypothetical protein
MKLLLVFAAALLCAIQSSSAQIGWTWDKCQSAYGQNPVSWWHRADSSYAQYYTPFWILNLYFNGDIAKDAGAIVTKANFQTISIVEAGGFHPVAISDIQSVMEKNSFGAAWTGQEYTFVVQGRRYTGYETQHENGHAFILAYPLDYNASGYYAGVELIYFSEYDNRHQADPLKGESSDLQITNLPSGTPPPTFHAIPR